MRSRIVHEPWHFYPYILERWENGAWKYVTMSLCSTLWGVKRKLKRARKKDAKKFLAAIVIYTDPE